MLADNQTSLAVAGHPVRARRRLRDELDARPEAPAPACVCRDVREEQVLGLGDPDRALGRAEPAPELLDLRRLAQQTDDPLIRDRESSHIPILDIKRADGGHDGIDVRRDVPGGRRSLHRHRGARLHTQAADLRRAARARRPAGARAAARSGSAPATAFGVLMPNAPESRRAPDRRRDDRRDDGPDQHALQAPRAAPRDHRRAADRAVHDRRDRRARQLHDAALRGAAGPGRVSTTRLASIRSTTPWRCARSCSSASATRRAMALGPSAAASSRRPGRPAPEDAPAPTTPR